MPLSAQQTARDQYELDGYVVFRNVLDADLVAEADAHVDWLRAKHPDLRPENLGHWLVKDDPFWVRLVSDDRLLDIAEQFIGPDIALFASHYICKPPKDGMPVLWHQDGSYWPLDPMEVVTLWLSVSDSKPENGCMRVIPRTQHTDLQEMRKREDIASVLGSGMDESLVDVSQAVDIVMQPGDVSVHHPNVIHGSEGNASDRWRKGLTIRYIPTTTRITDVKKHISAFHLRGNDAGVNEYHEKPKYVEGVHMRFRGCETWA
jgi:ectoine hydroxylase-related dioxygenase (phytanoyl-CoA dioxygenase family)